MRVYIATKFENTEGFNAARELLEKGGHEVTHDWTVHDATKVPEAERAEYLAKCAHEDGIGVITCDAFLLLAKPNMAGAFVELGIALALGKAVLIVGAKDEGNADCIFYHIQSPLLVHAASLEAAVDLLTDAQKLANELQEQNSPNGVPYVDGEGLEGRN